MRVLRKQNPHLFFMFLPESSRSIPEGGMHSSGVVIGDLPVNRQDQFFYALVVSRLSEFQLELSVIGFLCSVLPGGSFVAHGDNDVLCLEEIKNHITRILRSLVRMEVFRDDSSRSPYRILYCRKHELFGMTIG